MYDYPGVLLLKKSILWKLMILYKYKYFFVWVESESYIIFIYFHFFLHSSHVLFTNIKTN